MNTRTAAFRLANPWHLLATGFGSGLAPRAPGTFGTLFGWLCYALGAPYLNNTAMAVLLLVSFAVGVLACHKAGRDVGVADHGSIVWDEIVAIWLVLWVAAMMQLTSLAWQLAAVVAFRVFDIGKIPPTSWVDRNMKHGFGVMLDDMIAALQALLALAVIKHLLG